jgi:hypothetical protein
MSQEVIDWQKAKKRLKKELKKGKRNLKKEEEYVEATRAPHSQEKVQKPVENPLPPPRLFPQVHQHE